jgi:class 3 adenylate cyclase
MGCGTALGATATTRGVRKTVTALFCDLVGSTSLGERFDPEVLRPVLDAYFDEARAAVERHGGRVEKFIGDAVSAVFGLPQAHEDDALRAVRAGVEVQERLARLRDASPVPLAARVGITTGEVLVPGGGAPLIGDAMNTASRLQSSAQAGEVVIGEPTWRLVQDAVTAEALPPVEARGKAEPVAARRVLAVASASPMRARRLDAPMVGREREAAALHSAFERALSDRACVLFTVLGVAGAGKSRLVEEFLGSLAADDAEVLRGRCLPYGDRITYLPVAEALRDALGLPEFADVERVRTALAAAVANEDRPSALEADLAPLFAAGAPASPEETARAVRRFLESRGRDRPVVVVLDDIHWGEPVFLDLIEHIADWARNSSILLLCMARPELLDIRPAWGGGKANAATVSLAPLSAEQTGRLVRGLLDGEPVPAEAERLVNQIAGGNPLFAEELVRMLVDEGRLTRDGNAWRVVGPVDGTAIPPTVSALLSSRLDRLDDPERRVVEAASVEGQVFHHGAVAALLPADQRAQLDAHLRTLVRRDLVAPERTTIPSEDAYRFRHILIRDAAYDAIPKASRSAHHLAFADWLEGLAAERLGERQEIVAYHLERAYRYREELGLPEDAQLRLQAGRALGDVGILAYRSGVSASARELLPRAADLLEGDPAELRVLTALAELQGTQTRWAEAATSFEQLERAGIRHQDRAYELRGREGKRTFAGILDPTTLDFAAGLALSEEALAAYQAGASTLVPYGVFAVAAAQFELGHCEAAAAGFEEAIRLAREKGDRPRAALSVMWLLHALTEGRAPLPAVVETAGRLAREFSDWWYAHNTAVVYSAQARAWMGDRAGARAEHDAFTAAEAEAGEEADLLSPPAVRGFGAYAIGALEEALEALAELRRRVADYGHRQLVGWWGVPLARSLLELDRDAEAVPIVADIGSDAYLVMDRIQVTTLGALLAARRGDLDEAFRQSAAARDAVRGTDLLREHAYVALDLAEILRIAGRPDAARERAAEALELFARKEYVAGIRQTRALLARLD